MLREKLLQHFPDLTEEQISKLGSLKEIYTDWNEKINLISRKDIESFDERHLLHSLALKYVWKPRPDDKAIDIGTGGGFPGIPLAIVHPEVEFLLVDSIGKKIKVVDDVARRLGLENVRVLHERAEKVEGNFDVAISRAVAKLKLLIGYCKKSSMSAKELICLKGGDLRAELNEVGNYQKSILNLSEKFDEEFFETKCVVQVLRPLCMRMIKSWPEQVMR